MKKLAIIVCVLVLSLLVATPALAYDGVSGATFDGLNKDSWQYGGTVYFVGTTGGVGGQLLGSTTLSETAGSYGEFSFDWTTPPASVPDDGTDVTVVIVFNDGGNGTPQTQQYTAQVTQFSFIPGMYSMGNVETGTGPTAITLGNVAVSSSGGVLPIALMMASLLVVGLTVVVVRKRN